MKLGLIGAGNMASALARGIGEPVVVHDLDRSKAKALADDLGGEAVESNVEVADRSDAVILCHKPKQLEEVASEIGGRARVVVSILAATGTERIAEVYPEASVYRFIPNIPAEVRRGVLAYVRGPRADQGPEDEILQLMGRTGTVIRLEDEPLIEPAMALMACGPGFMALVAEKFAEAGVAHGLDPDDAMRMVVETMGGTADYLAEHGYDGPALRTRVATPGGTTEKGLIALEEHGLGDVTRAAVDAVVEATR
jgi:pyrroline-5-carboxylate reductase